VCCPAGSLCATGQCILNDATEVAVGRDHACAATTSTRLASPSQNVPSPTTENNVVCWGTNFFPGTTSSAGIAEPEYAAMFPYRLYTDMGKLSSGDDETVGFHTGYFDPLNPDHTNPQHWGYISNSYTNPVDGWLSQAVQLTAGGHHGCGMWPEGVYCWGNNDRGQTGNNNLSKAVCQQRMECFVSDLNGHVFDGNFGLTATQISAGANSTCAVLQAPAQPPTFVNKGAGQTLGNVACWGDNTDGKLGQPLAADGGVDLTALALEVPDVSNATFVSVGADHAVAIVNSGTELAFWGRNDEGEFGDGTNTSTPGTPIILSPGRTVTAVSAGYNFTCYLSGGLVYCAGRNNLGQLGHGTTTDSNVFVPVLGLAGVTAISAGGVAGSLSTPYGSACALTSTKNVYCWGDNSQGQLGDGGASGAFSASPVLVRLASHPTL
jgi:alpha-tubulin suppressor-like RCC1 family protein